MPIQVSQVKDLGKAFIFVELPERVEDFESKMNKIKELIKASKQIETFRIGALAQCLVAAGAFDAYVDFSGTSTIYNQAASKLIVHEAGGEIIDLDKTSGEYLRLLATNKRLAPEINKILTS